MAATPERASAAESATATGVLDHPAGIPPAVVVGGEESISTVARFAVSVLPAASTDQYSTVVVPSAVMVTGAE